MGSSVGVEGNKGRDAESALEFDDNSTLYISISSDTETAYSKVHFLLISYMS